MMKIQNKLVMQALHFDVRRLSADSSIHLFDIPQTEASIQRGCDQHLVGLADLDEIDLGGSLHFLYSCILTYLLVGKVFMSFAR